MGAEDRAEEGSEEVEEGAGSLSLEAPTAGLSPIALLEPGHEMMALASIWRPPVSSSSVPCQGWDRPSSSMAASQLLRR